MVLQCTMLEWGLMSIEIPMSSARINYVSKFLTVTPQGCFLRTENCASCPPWLSVLTLPSRVSGQLVVAGLSSGGSECLTGLPRVLVGKVFLGLII